MSLQNRFKIGIGLVLCLLLGPGSAAATTYTITAPIHMDDGLGNVLDLLPVYDDTGVGAPCLSGDCSGPDYLIFEVSVTAGAFQEIFASAIGIPPLVPSGLGYIAGAGTVPSSGSVVGGGGQFDFGAPNLSGLSVTLFSSYASLATAVSTTFSATPVTDPLFSSIGGIAPIPEPGTASLLGLGLVALAGLRRASRR